MLEKVVVAAVSDEANEEDDEEKTGEEEQLEEEVVKGKGDEREARFVVSYVFRASTTAWLEWSSHDMGALMVTAEGMATSG